MEELSKLPDDTSHIFDGSEISLMQTLQTFKKKNHFQTNVYFILIMIKPNTCSIDQFQKG